MTRLEREDAVYPSGRELERTAIGEVCCEAGISEAAFDNWHKKYLGLMPLRKRSELRNRGWRRFVAILPADRVLQQVILASMLRV